MKSSVQLVLCLGGALAAAQALPLGQSEALKGMGIGLAGCFEHAATPARIRAHSSITPEQRRGSAAPTGTVRTAGGATLWAPGPLTSTSLSLALSRALQTVASPRSCAGGSARRMTSLRASPAGRRLHARSLPGRQPPRPRTHAHFSTLASAA